MLNMKMSHSEGSGQSSTAMTSFQQTQLASANSLSGIQFGGAVFQHQPMELDIHGNTSNLAVNQSPWKSRSFASDENHFTEGQDVPDKYSIMMAQMLEIQKTLETVKTNLRQTSVRCHLLNVDVVTMFNPETVDTMNKMVEDCESCTKAMNSMVVDDDYI